MKRPQSFAFNPEAVREGIARSVVRRQRPENKWRIEGEYVTQAEIADRLGITVKTANPRMAKLQKASGPITWSRLGALPQEST